METVRAVNPIKLHPSDTEDLAFVFEDALAAGVTIGSVVSIAVDPVGTLAFSGAAPNAAAFNDRPNAQGKTVPVGKAALARPSGQVAGTDYDVTVVVLLSSGRQKAGVWDVRCRDGSEADA